MINRDVPSATLVKEIEAHGGDILQNAQVFDVYEGEHVARMRNQLQLDYHT